MNYINKAIATPNVVYFYIIPNLWLPKKDLIELFLSCLSIAVREAINSALDNNVNPPP